MKKNFLFLLLVLMSVGLMPKTANASSLAQHPESLSLSPLDLSKSSVEQSLGRKLSLKEKIELRVVKKQLNNAEKAQGMDGQAGGTRSWAAAILLCLFLGALGIHRFYLGYTGWGIVYLFTAGLFGIGVLVDLIRIIIKSLKPKRGSYD